MIAEQPVLKSSQAISSPRAELHLGKQQMYLLTLLGVPLFFYLLPVLLLRIPSFERWGGSPYGPVMDYAFHTGDQNADILIVGDSTAPAGIDPLLLTQKLGNKALVLPNTIVSLPVVGEIALQRYLASNRPPRLIVLSLTPWNLDYMHKNQTTLFEAEEMLFRNGNAAEISSFLKLHLRDALLFPLRYYKVGPINNLQNLLHHRHPTETLSQTRGHYDPEFMAPAIAGSCVFPQSMTTPVSFASAQEFVRRYTTPQTSVLVYNAPIPNCGNASLITSRSYQALDAPPPQTLEPVFFKSDPYYVHPDSSGVPLTTALMAEAIKTRFH